MLKRLRKINQEGSAYNLLGLLFPMSCQPNIMFCSQFVYAMLRLAGLHYFRKNPLQVRPTDFVEWDRRGGWPLWRSLPLTEFACTARIASPR